MTDRPPMLVFVRLAREVGAIERALGPFTVAGLVPFAMRLRQSERASLFMLARFDAFDSDRALSLVARLRAMPCVRSVKLSVSGGWQKSSPK